MKICPQCNSHDMRAARLPSYVYDLGGIRVDVMDSALSLTCSQCDCTEIVVPNHEGLIAAAAVARAHVNVKLNGSEIRFLRKAATQKAGEIASMLNVSAETFSRWENDKAVISPRPERLFRVVIAESLSDKAPAVDLDLGAILKMEINPLRNNFDLELMRFELVRLKIAHEKRSHWDTLEEALAA